MKAFPSLVLLCLLFTASGQEQVDRLDVGKGAGAPPSAALAIRVRVTEIAPLLEKARVHWRCGGEGLGGTPVHGDFVDAAGAPELSIGAWSGWLPLADMLRDRGWNFPTLVVSGPESKKGRKAASSEGVVESTAVEFEFAEAGKVFKSFTEKAPKGSTVGFAVPGHQQGERTAGHPAFVAGLEGLLAHARTRRESLEAAVPGAPPVLRKYGIVGHLAGYGEGAPAAHSGGAGYGVRHANPEILAEECRTMRMLGINGVVGSPHLVDMAGFGDQFRRIYWGGPGSGSPMGFLGGGGKGGGKSDACPFDPRLRPHVAQAAAAAIEEHRAVGARESWALWDDEIGVYAKDHLAQCPVCAEHFRGYLQANKVSLEELGAPNWEAVQPYDIWTGTPAKERGGAAVARPPLPATPGDALRYYYTSRFMTWATAQVFPEAARLFHEAGIPLYAMQGPTPSWSGASLDWHEFYDGGANTAVVWETSNRDARAWPWESYLAGIASGIAGRHQMPIGCLIKPHRGAPAQRMLAVAARGARVLEWYTYGPDYAKGDSFSQSPELLVRVAQSARFLAANEEFLYGATPLQPAEVAFVSPRSSEIWGRATDLGVTAFEDAKWVWTALLQAHVPVEILSEEQLAEGDLARFKVAYVVGPNLRRDAAAKVEAWVRGGGTLWTDAMGLAFDEANQPAPKPAAMFGLAARKLETWGSVEPYKAVAFKPLTETGAPAGAEFSFGDGKLRATIGREPLQANTATTLARFADGQPALTEQACGKGKALVAGTWAGLDFSAKVRRSDFDMRTDFDPGARDLIARPAIDGKVRQPAIPSDAQVEAIALRNGEKRAVALINWAYRANGEGETFEPSENLRIDLRGLGEVKTVRSAMLGPLEVNKGGVSLPQLSEIDLLYLE